MNNGKAFSWRTVQDTPHIIPYLKKPEAKSKTVGVSTYDGRANGLLGIAVVSRVTDNITQVTRSVYHDPRNEDVVAHFKVQPKIIPQTGWKDWLGYLTDLYIYVHPMPAASAGRDTIACAALGIPVIGNKELDVQMSLFPKLGTGCYDVRQMETLLEQLLKDKKFYDEVREFASERVKFFSVEEGLPRADWILRQFPA